MKEKEKENATAILETKRSDVYNIDPRLIKVQEGFNGRQVFDPIEMEELKNSIRGNGVRVPILVKKVRGEEKYLLVNGERRLRACMMLIEEGLELRMPATLFQGSETDAVIDMLITNSNVALNSVEEADIFNRLFRMGLTKEEIERKTGRTQAYISSLKTLHEAPQRIKMLITGKTISSTLVLQVIRDNKDNPEEGYKAIEMAVEANKAEGKEKVTSKHVEKAANKCNSFRELKKIVKLMRGKKVKPEAEELALFAKRVVDNRISFKSLEEMFFED